MGRVNYTPCAIANIFCVYLLLISHYYEWVGGCIKGWVDGWLGGWVGGWVDRWIGGWVGGWWVDGLETVWTHRLIDRAGR